MSLAAFPIQTRDMPRRPLRKQHFQAHGNAVFREKPLKNNARKDGPFPKHPLQTLRMGIEF